MNDLLLIVTRFLLYLDFMLLFGLSFFEIYAMKDKQSKAASGVHFRSFTLFAIVAGVVLTFVNMVIIAQAMTGTTGLAELSLHTIDMVVEDTDVGTSWLVRLGALALGFVGVLTAGSAPALSRAIITFSGGVALVTLAWGGHAVMHDGINFWVHLFSDVVHIIAVGTWVGALAAFAIMLFWPGNRNSHFVTLLSRALNDFGKTGSLIVMALIVSAAVNYVYIAGWSLMPLVSSMWGLLLLVKTGLFLMMLMLAAANRFSLAPQLEHAIDDDDYQTGIALMRRSIVTEFILAVTILAAVAWLGTLSPAPMM